jgi:hypothetical protein
LTEAVNVLSSSFFEPWQIITFLFHVIKFLIIKAKYNVVYL